MKKYLGFILVVLGFSMAMSQRFCYVDTDYILENLPSYKNAQSMIQRQSEQWSTELKNKQDSIAKAQAEFEAEKILLTQDQIKEQDGKFQEAIKSAKELQEKRYGPKGDLFKLRISVVKPIQDQVYNATKQIADKRGYGFVFDKGSDLIMIYTDPKFDISRDVLNILNPSANSKDTKKTNNNSKSGSSSSGKKTNKTTTTKSKR